MLPQLNQVALMSKSKCWVCPLALSPMTDDAKEPKETTDLRSVYEKQSVFVKSPQTCDSKAKEQKRKRSKTDALLSTLDVCVLILLHHV